MTEQNLSITKEIGRGANSKTFEVEGGNEPYILKIYNKDTDPFSVIKGVVVLNAFRNFTGNAPKLEQFFPEGLGFSVGLLDPKSWASLHTKIEGKELSQITEPLGSKQTSKLMVNVIRQLSFVQGIDLPADFNIPGSAEEIFSTNGRPTFNYHGDISDTAVILSENEATLIDWDASLNEGLGFVNAHPIYSAPEVWEGSEDLKDTGLTPHMADAYSLGGVLVRMLLGENFYDALDKGLDSREEINPEKIISLLKEAQTPDELIGLVSKLLSNNPEERLINGATSALENLNNILSILDSQITQNEDLGS